MRTLSTERNKSGTRELYEFTQGIEVDSRLAEAEVQVQLAWVQAIAEHGLLSPEELAQAERLLKEALRRIKDGSFPWRIEDEDIHMNLERFLTEQAGALGKKIHLGRSRNDLIATTLRLHVASRLNSIADLIKDSIEALITRAEMDIDVLIPGLTHLQHGQPIRYSHALLAHAWAFARDLRRIRSCKDSTMEHMPLGSAALAGSTLPLDYHHLAKSLGFAFPTPNSYDSVGDRDFILEAIQVFALTAVHLSRLAEDCIIWASTAVGLVKLPRRWSTGSSIMPNKRNPDIPELVRAKAAHVMGASANAQALLKAVPTSYGSDLHELKRVFMNAADELSLSLQAFTPFLRELEPDPRRARELLKKGHILATEIADFLTEQGTPFREAYTQVAALVELAETRGIQIEDLPQDVWASAAPKLTEEFMRNLTPLSAVERRTGPGGTARERIQKAAEKLRLIINNQT